MADALRANGSSFPETPAMLPAGSRWGSTHPPPPTRRRIGAETVTLGGASVAAAFCCAARNVSRIVGQASRKWRQAFHSHAVDKSSVGGDIDVHVISAMPDPRGAAIRPLRALISNFRKGDKDKAKKRKGFA